MSPIAEHEEAQRGSFCRRKRQSAFEYHLGART